MAWERGLIFVWITVAASLIGICQGNKLEIIALRVPGVIQEGDMESVVLDCDYTLKHSEGLVLKWYFIPEGSKASAKLIYQWIPEKDGPQAIGAFRNSINLSYKASENPHYQYRAMNLLKPSRNMSGTYQCVVDTFTEGPAKSSAKMIVYVPPKTLQFSQEKNEDGSIEVSCTANDVFPTPVMNIRVENKIMPDIESNVTQEHDLLYDIRVETDLDMDELPEDPTKVFCELSLPDANYNIKQEGIIYKVNSANMLMPCLQLLMALYCSYFVL
ncbi:uncharacterized protein LOC113363403 isoform X2 [Ctenocephalides felis]|uniref:uncharacterized protein LOC113363403 isoform X2 n=1 Tax=Ctenocephalides felis TaxID=7515 RepID=UPI000E6E298F|nr:uncharacterized protein LOC113363403 isoform X2 [Ctenocephalides felis]